MGNCATLDQLFQNLQDGGAYPVTIVSNQPDGIVGFGGTFPGSTGLTMRKKGPGQLSGDTRGYLLSDRTFDTPPQDGFVGPPQGFSIFGPDPLSASVQRDGTSQYTLLLHFTGGINRTYEISAQCVGEAIVGVANAIGNNEHVNSATYTVTVGSFVPDPVIH